MAVGRPLIKRLKTRLAQLEKLDVANKYATLRTGVGKTIAAAEANPRAFDMVSIVALIEAIVQITALIKGLRK